ncbi:MAG: SusE domain-containing protein [Aquaticitalea sp.]
MKNIKILLLLIVALIGFNSCQEEDDFQFTAQEPTEFAFSNSFSSEYVLTPATSGNLGERFTWNDANFGVPTSVTYDLQSSITGDFTDAETVGTTSGNEIPVTVEDLLNLARIAGLDNNPDTDAPNMGEVFFRVKAYIGTDAALDVFSTVQSLMLVLPENTDEEETPVCEFDALYAVGAGIATAGWDWATPAVFECTGTGVYSGNVELFNGGALDASNFRFFTEASNWDSGQNYPFFADAGYTIDANLVNATDGDSNFAFVGTSGVYNLTIDTVNLTITLGAPQAGGECEVDILYGVGAGLPTAGWDWATPVELICSGDGIWSGNVSLQNNGGADNNFRFFTEATNWDSGRNYPFYADAGYTIDANLVNAMDGDFNFAFVGTTGTYLLTIDSVAKTITLE